MRFSKDDFQCNIHRWERLVETFPKEHPVSYLELGVYEGRSLFWLVEKLFKNPGDRAVAVDRFYNSARERFFENLESCKFKKQIRVLEGDFRSSLIQLQLEKEQFDFIYEDGTHVSSETMETLCLLWPLLKVGGVLVIDDYEWNEGLPSEFTNSFAIDSFLKMYRQEIEIVEMDHQVVVKKLQTRKNNLDSLEIGDWVYHWYEGVLYHLKAGKEVRLTEDEKKYMKVIFKSLKWESAIDRLAFERQFQENLDLQMFLQEKESTILSI